jgi:general secretion pathway protein C
MSRWFPIAVLVVATAIGAGGGVASTSMLRTVVAPETPSSGVNAAPAVGTTVATAPAPKVARGPTDEQYLKGILCRNLFDPSKVGQCDLKKDEPAKDEGIAATPLNVTLLGTLVAEPASFSSALILEEGAERPIGYSITDVIQQREIVAIAKKRVTLRNPDGSEEVLTMDEDAPPPTRGGSSTPIDEGESVQKTGDNEYTITSEELDKHLSDLEGLSRMGRALLHRGPDGEFDGYRLSAIRRNTIADKLGIKNGDIVHSVNGKPLTSMAAAMEAYNTMQNEKAFTFEVTRRGQKQTMRYNVQ